MKSEWPTLLVALGCYLSYLGFTYFSGSLGLFVIPLLALTMTLHSSLQHEVLHGHPFRSQTLSEALVFPAIGLFIPYERFRDTHLRHHHDPNLTDPYDDPESNYLDPAIWGALPSWVKSVLRFNNTLFGRMLVGPLIGTVAFWKSDIDEMRGGDRTVIRAYLMHGLGVLLVLGWLWMVWEVSLWSYLLAAYVALSILKIRTFLEHRAHEAIPGRTVIIEDRGLLAFLFLNNNFHAAHHAHPKLCWYQLPDFYAQRKTSFLDRNRHYRYGSYWEIFREYLFASKDEVPHPLMENTQD